jgi:hypothetical protein
MCSLDVSPGPSLYQYGPCTSANCASRSAQSASTPRHSAPSAHTLPARFKMARTSAQQLLARLL